MSVNRTPPASRPGDFYTTANVAPELSEMITIEDFSEEEEINYPSRKLAAITRIRSKIIENKFAKNEENFTVVKNYLGEYIKRKKIFEDACEQELRKKAGESFIRDFQKWRDDHMIKMRHFEEETNSWLGEDADPTIYPGDSASNVGSVSSSCVSAASSNAILVERKIQIEKQKKIVIKTALLKEKELDAKLAYERVQLRLKTEADTLAIESESEAVAELEQKFGLLQREIKYEQGISLEKIDEPNLANVLSKQNDLTRMLIENQARTQLPHHEPEFFDGEDVTQYQSFILTFERSIERGCLSADDKYYFLLKYTKGQAREIVLSCQGVNSEASYVKARELLRKNFGNEYEIAHKYLSKLQEWDSIKSEDTFSLEKFGRFLTTCLNSMGKMAILNQLNSWRDLKEITMKLPYDLRKKFRALASKNIKDGNDVKFETMVNFVNEQVDIMKFPFFGDISDRSITKQKFSTKPNFRSFYTDTEETTETENFNMIIQKDSCPCCLKNNHHLDDCFFFLKKSLSDREDFVRSKNLCFGCLGNSNHRARNCVQRLVCKKCSKLHPSSLHKIIPNQTRNDDDSSSSSNREARAMNSFLNGKQRVVCAAIPVILRDKISNKSAVTYMGLDNFSTASYVDKELARSLGCKGKSTVISLTTMENKISPVDTEIMLNLEVSSLSGDVRRPLPQIYAKNNWPFEKKDSPSRRDLEGLKGFESVPFDFVDCKIGILIGMDMPEFLHPREIITISKTGPYVSRHLFGYALNGPVKGSAQSLNCFKTSDVNLDAALEEKIQKYFTQDFIDVEDGITFSPMDETWLEKTKSRCIMTIDNHYQIPLPLKDSVHEMPDNSNYVRKRFEQLQRKLRKNINYSKEYIHLMREMQQRNFVEEVPAESTELSPGSGWYLTHHGVRHKQKGKLRIVFDCSLRYNGISLNDNLFKGPDLTNSIFGVLVRFREHEIAFSADIEKMFYMVKLPESDRNYLRFYWFADDVALTGVKIFRLTVHVFGATSSPSIANFALRQTVVGEECSSAARKTVLTSFYVDDLLKSVANESVASNLLKEIRHLLSQGGFNLTSICSNSRSILYSVPTEKHSKELHGINIANEILPCERTLGILWDVERDMFRFRTNLAEHPFTKRGILSTIFSIFDPFFITCPVIIPAKRIFQRACFLKLDWDESLPDSLHGPWTRWLKRIELLNGLEVPRNYCRGLINPNYEIHIFCDGSEVAYGAVAYLRCSSLSEVKVTIVAAKVRMTPLNRSVLKTVPRIELNAAKIAVSLYLQLKSELELDVGVVYFWSDSAVVLSYIKSEDSSFHRYVANRIAYIRSHTNPSFWHHVPGTLNPADLLSRGVSNVQTFITDTTWFEGPAFLKDVQRNWPKFSEAGVCENDPEIKVKTFAAINSILAESPTEKLINSSSNFIQLKRNVAIFLRLKKCLQKKPFEKQRILMSEMEESELTTWRYTQESNFRKTISLLVNKNELPKSDPLFRLGPFMGEDGLLRVGGRLRNAQLPYSAKHPIVLPNSALPVILLVKKIHEECGHLGREAVLSALKVNFHIVGGNALVRKIIRKCMICLKVQGKPSEQIMADLPADRVTGDLPVFSSTGTDFFGPFYVSRGRSKTQEKRYGVIFSCLASRAIHIEIAASLDTDSFVNALRRFVCRRGPVSMIRSDNGTNLVAGCKEINNSIKDWNQAQIDSFCIGKNIQWKFQPPTASHHGGVFEREIRTIRKVLNSLLQEFGNKLTITDEFLGTLMCEVEEILNNRPLTTVTSDASDLEALTPNLLLRLHSNLTFPPGLFDEKDIYVRRKWRQVQFVAEVFWRRWRREYLQLLQQRQKWSKISRNHAVGDLVLISDQKLPRNLWCVGRISSVKVDESGNVRGAKINVTRYVEGNALRIGKTNLERPITKLILLRQVEEL